MAKWRTGFLYDVMLLDNSYCRFLLTDIDEEYRVS